MRPDSIPSFSFGLRRANMSPSDHPAWLSPLHTIRDAISFATSAAALRRPAFEILYALQRHPPAVQMDSLFLTAVAMSEALGLDAHEMVSRAKRIMPDAEAAYTDHIQAVKDYARGELK
jgi:hypothetical protein